MIPLGRLSYLDLASSLTFPVRALNIYAPAIVKGIELKRKPSKGAISTQIRFWIPNESFHPFRWPHLPFFVEVVKKFFVAFRLGQSF